MTTIALKAKYQTEVQKKESIFRQIVNAYREYQAEIICGMLSMCGDGAAAIRMYQLLKK